MLDTDGRLISERTGTRDDNTRFAQRLWLLERNDDDLSSPYREVCRFTSAVAILSPRGIYVLLIRTPEANGTIAARLTWPGLRCDLERDAVRFAKLDEAIAWADAEK